MQGLFSSLTLCFYDGEARSFGFIPGGLGVLTGSIRQLAGLSGRLALRLLLDSAARRFGCTAGVFSCRTLHGLRGPQIGCRLSLGLRSRLAICCVGLPLRGFRFYSG